MQLDMHYYATFAMARAAGLNWSTARIIATASQFVDDNVHTGHVQFADKGRLDTEATSHHPLTKENLKPEDQRQVWIPFHFLPGQSGQTLERKMLCQKNSPLANDMIAHVLTFHKTDYFREYLGIVSHVFADTFAHWGFSGISSDENKVIPDSVRFYNELDSKMERYVARKRESFMKRHWNKAKTKAIQGVSHGLGHGAVMTYPDRPYMIWSYQEKKTGRYHRHNNPENFVDYCRQIFKVYQKVGRLRPDLSANDGVKFSDIKSTVEANIKYEAKKEDRIERWRQTAKDNLLFANPKLIVEYKDWNHQYKALDKSKPSRLALQKSVYKFYQGAAQHRIFVLRSLLPKYKMIVA
ncbi:MAG: hypothetical protein GY835_11095 [bacterium]|nr:hypothetical protein [bacterium]